MPHATHNRTLIILILGALSTISPFAIDMYLPAFPEIAAALHTSTARISLSIASYFAGLAAGQLLYGPLLDRFGRKLPLYAGLILFIAASLLCLLSRSVEWLVTMRFVQALGGCAAQVASMAMVRDFFPVRETAKIISLLILIHRRVPAAGPDCRRLCFGAFRLAMGLHHSLGRRVLESCGRLLAPAPGPCAG